MSEDVYSGLCSSNSEDDRITELLQKIQREAMLELEENAKKKLYAVSDKNGSIFSKYTGGAVPTKQDNAKYLTGMSQEMAEHGLCKVLAVRSEVIHIKHIMTEIFVRRSINIQGTLDLLGLDLFEYMEYLTNRLRHIHRFSRDYRADINKVVKSDRDNFFPTLELYSGLRTCIVLDFDGVVTSNNFRELYKLCIQRGHTEICSANPTITPEWFQKRDLPLPARIHSMRGKKQKVRKLIEINQKYDYTLYVDNEPEYLDHAWIFGISTWHFRNGKIMFYSKNTK